MPIKFDSEKKVFKLDTVNSSYIMEVFDGGHIVSLYYGAPIPDTDDLDYLRLRECACSSFSPKVYGVRDGSYAPDMSPVEYPTTGIGDYRLTALSIEAPDGSNVTDMRYVSHKIYSGKPAIDGLPATYANSDDEATTLEITLRDPLTHVETVMYYTVFEKLSAMARSVKIVNAGDAPVSVLKAASACLNLPIGEYEMIYNYGKYAKERNIDRQRIGYQTQSIKSCRGSSGHNYTPFAAFAREGAGEENGDVYGVAFVYSSNFSIDAEMDFFGSTRVTVGINPEGFKWHLDPGEEFHSPEAITVYSDAGLGEMSRIFHRLISKNLIRGEWRDKKRPLLINSWEAAGMGINADVLDAFAKSAAEMGFEMLVMDDGWFGHRVNDYTSLGDWYVNKDKFPNGLSDLIKKVNSYGMKFGIWYEPEMISEESDLYHAHPDWVLHNPGRDRSNARNQLMLDMTRKEVRDNVFEQMADVIANNNIDYIKWDMNRNFSEAYSTALPADRQGELAHRYMLGVYELMERILTAFPHILLESCSGGGGRYNYGILYYSPQVWTSDNTDAVDREYIQFGTSLCYPASSMGSHVSANWRTDYPMKGAVAMWGSFGYELNPLQLSDENKEEVRRQIADYHKFYDLIHYGDLYRLEYPTDDPQRCAWEFAAPDKSEALLTVVTNLRPLHAVHVIRLRGLDPDKRYRDEEDGRVYSGAALMRAGISTSFKEATVGDKSAFMKHFVEVKD